MGLGLGDGMGKAAADFRLPLTAGVTRRLSVSTGAKLG